MIAMWAGWRQASGILGRAGIRKGRHGREAPPPRPPIETLATKREIHTEGLDERLEALETTARRGLWWSVANNVVGRVGTTLVGIALARILVPEDYGVYAVALVVLNVSLSMNELGVSLAIVRWPGDVSRIAPTVATLSLLFSGLLWLAIFASAPAVAAALGASEATWVIRVLALAILIDAVTAVPAALIVS